MTPTIPRRHIASNVPPTSTLPPCDALRTRSGPGFTPGPDRSARHWQVVDWRSTTAVPSGFKVTLKVDFNATDVPSLPAR